MRYFPCLTNDALHSCRKQTFELSIALAVQGRTESSRASLLTDLSRPTPRIESQLLLAATYSLSANRRQPTMADCPLVLRASDWRCKTDATKGLALLQGCAAAVAKIDRYQADARSHRVNPMLLPQCTASKLSSPLCQPECLSVRPVSTLLAA